MVSIGQVPGKTEGSQVNKYQEMDKIHQIHLIRNFYQGGEWSLESSPAAQHIHSCQLKDYDSDIFRSLFLFRCLQYESHIFQGSYDTYFSLVGSYYNSTAMCSQFWALNSVKSSNYLSYWKEDCGIDWLIYSLISIVVTFDVVPHVCLFSVNSFFLWPHLTKPISEIGLLW